MASELSDFALVLKNVFLISLSSHQNIYNLHYHPSCPYFKGLTFSLKPFLELFFQQFMNFQIENRTHTYTFQNALYAWTILN